MSELSLVDWYVTLLGSGPGAALYAQLLSDGHEVTVDFAAPIPASIDPGLSGLPSAWVYLTLGVPDQLRAPMNGLLWHIPATSEFTPERKARWPRLTQLDGDEFSPMRLATGDLVLEVWASAFRRMEQVFASLEAPTFESAEHPPSRPVARWFVVRNVPDAAVLAATDALVAAQFGAITPPSLETFHSGDLPIYVTAGDVLALLSGGEELQVAAFDSSGMVLDPVHVFATFARMAADPNFFDLARPDKDDAKRWSSPAPRHVLVFSDHRGRPYEPREDSDDPDSQIVDRLRFRVGDDTVDWNAVLILSGTLADAHRDTEPRVNLEAVDLDGELLALPHLRIGLHPNGRLDSQLQLPLAEHSFARLRVVDWREWFPYRQWGGIVPGDDLARYTEGNELVPFADGQDTFRAIYRALRATYRDEDYADDRDIPEGAPFPPPVGPPRQALLSNAWITAHAFLLGRRAMLATPRTQPGVEPPDDLVSRLRLRPVPLPPPPPGDEPPATFHWWLLAPEGTLPPGAWVELQQLEATYDFVGDDPRHPENDRGSDLFGILVPPFGKVSGFVGSSGQFALPVTLAPDFRHRATLRVVTWEPEEGDADPTTNRGAGRGELKTRLYGGGGSDEGFVLPDLPADPGVPFLAEPYPRIDWDGVPGQAVLVVPAAALAAAPQPTTNIVAVNGRTGAPVVLAGIDSASPSEQRVPLDNFARNDWVAVGFLPAGATDITAAAFVFAASPGEVLAASGLAPVHPLEIGGVLRQAIAAGVDVRLLAWRDNTASFSTQLGQSDGMVRAVNAFGPEGLRGQAILDPTGREALGVHHQKGTFIRTAEDGVVAFVGGIDLKSTRWDNHAHRSVEPERPHTPWHDIHCRVRGRAAWDVYRNFQQRWNAARALPDVGGADPGLAPLPPPDPVLVEDTALTFAAGAHAVQINRTIAPGIDAYAGFLDPDKGDLSTREARRNALARARHFVYIEDQYLWDRDLAQRVRERLAAGDVRFAIIVLPKQLAEFPGADLVFYAARRRCLHRILYGKERLADPPGDSGGDLSPRVLVINLRNDAGFPCYVHCKALIVDDFWMSIGSSNFSRRSMTYDSELDAASVDARIRRGGQGTAHDFRIQLMAEHLGLLPDERPLLEDPDQAFAFMRAAVDGEVPWLIERRRCDRHDLLFTSYGLQPKQEEEAVVDALTVALDADGEVTHHGVRWIDLIALLRSGDSLSGLAALELTFDVSALGTPPADLRVTVEIAELGTGAEPPYAVGPFPGDATPRVAVLEVEVDYQVTATAAVVGTTVPVGSGTATVSAVPFLTPATITLTP